MLPSSCGMLFSHDFSRCGLVHFLILWSFIGWIISVLLNRSWLCGFGRCVLPTTTQAALSGAHRFQLPVRYHVGTKGTNEPLLVQEPRSWCETKAFPSLLWATVAPTNSNVRCVWAQACTYTLKLQIPVNLEQGLRELVRILCSWCLDIRLEGGCKLEGSCLP